MGVGTRVFDVGEGIEHRNAARAQAATQVAEELPRNQVVRCAVTVEKINQYDVMARRALPDISARVSLVRGDAPCIEAEITRRHFYRRRIDFDDFNATAGGGKA